jgi:hypothetical protein
MPLGLPRAVSRQHHTPGSVPHQPPPPAGCAGSAHQPGAVVPARSGLQLLLQCCPCRWVMHQRCCLDCCCYCWGLTQNLAAAAAAAGWSPLVCEGMSHLLGARAPPATAATRQCQQSTHCGIKTLLCRLCQTWKRGGSGGGWPQSPSCYMLSWLLQLLYGPTSVCGGQRCCSSCSHCCPTPPC